MAEIATVNLRLADVDDVSAVRAIDAAVYPKPWSERLTVQQLTGPNRFHLVALNGGMVIGHAGILILDGDAHITTIAVDPKHQGQGVGDALMRALLGHARGAGCAGVTLEVRAGNLPAIALYERHGLVRAGVRPRYYADNDEDAIIMWAGDGLGAERQWSDSVGVETDA